MLLITLALAVTTFSVSSPSTGAAAADVEQCLSRLSLDEPPVSGALLSIYRRCLTQMRQEDEKEKKFEQRLQRLDQHFWRSKESTDATLLKSEQNLRMNIRVNQKYRTNAQGTKSERLELLHKSRRTLRRSFRTIERETP